MNNLRHKHVTDQDSIVGLRLAYPRNSVFESLATQSDRGYDANISW